MLPLSNYDSKPSVKSEVLSKPIVSPEIEEFVGKKLKELDINDITYKYELRFESNDQMKNAAFLLKGKNCPFYTIRENGYETLLTTKYGKEILNSKKIRYRKLR